MPQPGRRLSWATDANYPAGPDAWSGGPTKDALTSGELAAGFTPNTQIPAQKLNDLLALISEHLESIVDSAAINWSPPELTVNDTPSFEGFGNGLFAGPIVAPGQWYGGIERETLLAFNAGGLYYSKDGREWVSKGGAGFGSPVNEATAGKYVFSGDDYVTIVAYCEDSPGEFRASDDFGTNWYATGQLPASAENNGVGYVMGYFPPAERFFWCTRSQLYYQDAADLSSTSDWTRINTGGYWTGAPPASPTCFAASPTECAIMIGGNPRVIRSTDGNTWAPADSGFTSFPKHLHWSASLGLWIALASDNSLWTAPEGMAAWTKRADPTWVNGSPLGTLRAAASLGRTLVLLAGAGIYASRNFTNWVRLSPHVATGVVDNWQFVVPFNGGLWASHEAHKSGGSGSTFEHTFSGVLPTALDEVGPW